MGTVNAMNDAWTLLDAVAVSHYAASSLAPLVLCSLFRDPSVVANMAVAPSTKSLAAVSCRGSAPVARP